MRRISIVALLYLFLTHTCSLLANDFSFAGNFESDDQVQLINLSLSSAGPVTLETLSYGGGINSVGSTIDRGGFAPRLTWFRADGTQIGTDNGGHCDRTNSYLEACNDAFFQGNFDAGDYVLALTQDGNDANGDLGDGFSSEGGGNFTAVGACTEFCDSLSGQQLNGHWAVDILTVDSASPQSTPEPGSIALAAIGLSLLACTCKKNR